MKELIIGMKNGNIAAAVLNDGHLFEYSCDTHDTGTDCVDSNIGTDVRTVDIYRGIVISISKELNASFVRITNNNIVYLEGTGTKQGANVILQIKHPPYADKDALAVTEISLKGKYTIVFSDTAQCVADGVSIGISKRIKSKDKRRCLKNTAESCSPQYSCIIRSEAEYSSLADLKEEIFLLNKKLSAILKKGQEQGKPELLYRDSGFLEKLLRERANNSVDKIVIHGTDIYKAAVEYLNAAGYGGLGKLNIFNGKTDIFDLYGVDNQLRAASNRKIYLKSGAYIVVDITEAMTVIDVNSGKYSKSDDFDKMRLDVNIEAAAEIARILQLRDISGIIVVDFLKMRNDKDKEQLLKCFREFADGDKGHTIVVGMTGLGLIELTRRGFM